MFAARVEKVKSELSKKGLDAVLISSPVTVTYLTGHSGFTGERDVFLLITQDKNFILTHSIYSNVLKVEGFEVVEISRRLPPQKILLRILGKEIKLGIEENNLTVSEYKKLKPFVVKNFEISDYRTIKTQDEIELIEQACQVGDKAYECIQKYIKEGISEKELAFKLEYFIKQKGVDLSFPTIAAFGKNSFAPHHQAGDKKLVSVKFKNYCSDMTRTFVSGIPTTEQKKMIDTVFAAQQKAIESAKNRACDVDKTTRDYIKSKGYPDIPHSVGHGIGLEVHEHPYISKKSKEILKNGMVFSIEPGIYVQGFGGARIEDLFVLENNKLRRLTNGVSQN